VRNFFSRKQNMIRNRSFIVAAGLVLGGLMLSYPWTMRTAEGQSDVSPPSSGKYQIVVSPEGNSGIHTVFVFEPATGQCWHHSTNPGTPGWRNLGSPVFQTKK
jgi:hypothetical protein